MSSISKQRSNIKKARKRDPIVTIFMHQNSITKYSISVPSSKSWQEFLIKIKKQFKLSPEDVLSLYHIPSIDDNSLDLNLSNLSQYDLEENDMSKIKHKNIFCVVIDNEFSDSNSQKRKRTQSYNSHSDNSSQETSSNSDSECKIEASNNIFSAETERNFGLDLDLFDRPCHAKKAYSSKKKGKPVYHFHSQDEIQSLDFHLKSTWTALKTQACTVRHLDDLYTMIQSADNRFSLRTRRMIWPADTHSLDTTFEYKLADISKQWKWAILIVHGGKFAGAIWNGNVMTVHKTLSRYVVRKKQGKRQANHLSSSGVKGGSAGGFKRARNEQKLLEEIREILAQWMDLLLGCDKVFVHAPGAHNQAALFGSPEEQNHLYPMHNGQLKEALSRERIKEVRNRNKNKSVNLYRLYKRDARIQQIPITTKGVTLREVERVHYWLSTCWLTKNGKQENAVNDQQ